MPEYENCVRIVALYATYTHSCFSVPPVVIMIPWERSRLQTILLIESIRLKEYETNRGPSHLQILILETVSVLYDHVVWSYLLPFL